MPKRSAVSPETRKRRAPPTKRFMVTLRLTDYQRLCEVASIAGEAPATAARILLERDMAATRGPAAKRTKKERRQVAEEAPAAPGGLKLLKS